jgi:hypothetical protein
VSESVGVRRVRERGSERGVRVREGREREGERASGHTSERGRARGR